METFRLSQFRGLKIICFCFPSFSEVIPMIIPPIPRQSSVIPLPHRLALGDAASRISKGRSLLPLMSHCLRIRSRLRNLEDASGEFCVCEFILSTLAIPTDTQSPNLSPATLSLLRTGVRQGCGARRDFFSQISYAVPSVLASGGVAVVFNI